MAHRLIAILLGVVIASCGAYWRAHTEGTSGPITWYVTDVKSESNAGDNSHSYAFTLILRETQGSPITFTTMTYTIYSGTATHEKSQGQTQEGRWKLQPHGQWRVPFRYAITCPELGGCVKIEAWTLAPIYHIILTGTDGQDKPVRVVIDMRLPPDPDAIRKP